MVYGIGTRSYNRSTEKRQMDRERKQATEAYEQSHRSPVTVELMCGCRSFQYPHRLEAHRRLLSEMDWTPWQERRNREVWGQSW